MASDELQGELHPVGDLIVACPRCGTDITIPITAGVATKESEPGKIYVRTDSDVADYWSHYFWHREQNK
jgi:hypothetical protein